MPVTKDEAHMLATLAVACRPHGAPRWDAPGVVAAVGKVAHLSLADVALATIRAADDSTTKTPGVIGNTRSECWRERKPNREIPRLPKAGQDCPRHPGNWPASCHGCAADRLAGEDDPPKPRRDTNDVDAAKHANFARELMRAAKHDTEED